MRGKGGGWDVLTRPPEQYTGGRILRLTEGRRSKWLFAFDECRPTLDVWKNLDKPHQRLPRRCDASRSGLSLPNHGYDCVI